jgi:cytidyltransferase-like protein
MELKKYDKIYTIGCFDWFHHGHRILLENIKARCDTLIVGIHDDASLEQLKNLDKEMHQTINQRMENVKKYADIVYVIPDKNPTFFLKCVIQGTDNKENACYMRSNDMMNFPGRDLVESMISLEFTEYTDGVSSTQIRKTLKSNIK